MGNNWSEFIEYLEASFDAVHVSGGAQLKLNGQCPFCAEDRADLRLYVNTETGLGQCFHCGQGFGPISFVMAREKCSFEQAKKIVQGDPEAWDRTKDEPKPDPELAWPQRTEISASPIAQRYLDERGISHKLVQHFGIYFTAHPVVIGKRLFHTENRIIVPIHDIDGKPVSWIGRTVNNAYPKYLFPPAFKGAQTLFNAWSVGQNSPYLIICEGVMDVFGWWRCGVKNAIATFGKKISHEQVSLIRRINPKLVLIAWDSDAHWEKCEFAKSYGHIFENIKIVDLGGKDADECSPSEMAIALAKAKGYIWEDQVITKLMNIP